MEYLNETKNNRDKLEKNIEENVNRCVICGIDMGVNNPRQLCRKTYCENVNEN